MSRLETGLRVTVSRDETKYPSKGTWPQWRGRTGTITAISPHRRKALTEYGLVFGQVYEREDGSLQGTTDPVWFLGHELVATEGDDVSS